MSYKKIFKKIYADELVHLTVSVGFILIASYVKKNFGKIDIVNGFAIIFCLFLLVGLYVYMRYSVRKEEEQETKSLELKIDKIKSELARDRPVYVEFIPNLNETEDKAYYQSLLAVMKANKDIMIIADNSTSSDPLTPTMTRQLYYKVIENKLEEICKELPKDVVATYTRFMQREKTIWDKIHSSRGQINDNKMIEFDEQAYAHCKRVLDIKAKNRNLKIEIKVTPSIPSMPSILIIDSNNMLFTIPKKKNAPNNKEKDPILTAGALDFTDFTKDGSAIIKPFIEIFKTLNFNGNDNVDIEFIDEFNDNPKFQKWYKGFEKDKEYIRLKKIYKLEDIID